MPKFDITKLNVAIDKLLERLPIQDTDSCSWPIADIAIWRLQVATRRFLRQR